MLEAHKDLHGALLEALNSVSPTEDMTPEMNKVSDLYSSMGEREFVHINNTNKPKYDKSYNSSSQDSGSKKASKGSVATCQETKTDCSADGKLPNEEKLDAKEQWKAAVSEELGRISWKQVLNACSDRFKQQFPLHDRPLDWSDIVEAASAMLPILGISKSAWWEACTVLGRHGAAICVMVIDQKAQADNLSDRVRNPGGYLREMTNRAKKGELNLHGSVFGLLKRAEGDKEDA